MNGGVDRQTKASDNLFAGDFPRVVVPVVIVTGSGSVVRGTLLGRITASGKYKPYNDSNNDGSQAAKLVLAETVDATSADVKTTAYAAGEFNEAALNGLDAAARLDFEPGTSAIFIKKVY